MLDPDRAEALRAVFSRHGDVLLVEDDYVAAVAGAPYFGLGGAAEQWAVISSVSKVLGPDLRIAPMAGDPRVPVAEEVPVVQHLLELGWAVSAGERYRFRTPAGIRITTSGLETGEAEELAAAIAASFAASGETYAA